MPLETDAVSVKIRAQPVTLGQFLKLARLAATGGEAKALVQSGAVQVNGEAETRRARKLMAGDVVTVTGHGAFRVHLAER
jgi:ribosome-associated protein